MSPLDRAARALFEHPAVSPPPNCAALSWNDQPGAIREAARNRVRAVLAALDPPTPGMVEAGRRTLTLYSGDSVVCAEIFSAMLAAAREGE